MHQFSTVPDCPKGLKDNLPTNEDVQATLNILLGKKGEDLLKGDIKVEW